jgi:hypothetical protein
MRGLQSCDLRMQQDSCMSQSGGVRAHIGMVGISLKSLSGPCVFLDMWQAGERIEQRAGLHLQIIQTKL